MARYVIPFFVSLLENEMQHDYLKLCLITDLSSKPFNYYEKLILHATRGGITSLQIREKKIPLSELRFLALSVLSLLKPFNIPLILNDHVMLAQEINAQGVHLGQSDMTPIEARKILGDKKIIGLSIESLADLQQANQLNCINYIAASAVFKSTSKQNCKTYWGLDGLQNITQKTHHPVIAIGGIDLTNTEPAMQTGAAGIAVISAIHNHSDPEKISSLLIQKINNHLQRRKSYV